MPTPLFDLPPVLALPVTGTDDTYPIARIFCVGRNYAAHAAEMGNEVDREAPFYFTKNPRHAVLTGAKLPYPPGTDDYHHEMEFVFALGAPLFRATAEQAQKAVLGYGCGFDMTRRDLQAISKSKRRPWDTGKDVEGSAVLGPLTPAAQMGPIHEARIHLEVNGQTRQDAVLADMIHSVTDILVDLSRLYHLAPGDIVMTGTPAGVGPVVAGDGLVGSITGLSDVTLELMEAE